LFTVEEAADLLRLGRTTIYALIRAGDIRPVHIGRCCRVSRGELDRYVTRLDEGLKRVPDDEWRPVPDNGAGCGYAAGDPQNAA
jgi:excisionase family DNA binding protein